MPDDKVLREHAEKWVEAHQPKPIECIYCGKAQTTGPMCSGELQIGYLAEFAAALIRPFGWQRPIAIHVFQQDWIPGFAAFHDDGILSETAKAHVVLNLGSFMSAIQTKDLDPKDLPYIVAESLMHEVVHVLEAWANVEFSEDRVEELLTKYREKYQRATVWEYTGGEPRNVAERQDEQFAPCPYPHDADSKCPDKVAIDEPEEPANDPGGKGMSDRELHYRFGLIPAPKDGGKREKPMTADQIKYMVERFLGWRLPDNFNPDGGISFKPTFNEQTSHPMKHEPTGTNLFDYTQAEAMVRYMVEGMPVVEERESRESRAFKFLCDRLKNWQLQNEFERNALHELVADAEKLNGEVGESRERELERALRTLVEQIHQVGIRADLSEAERLLG